jgi:hypothetical protein
VVGIFQYLHSGKQAKIIGRKEEEATRTEPAKDANQRLRRKNRKVKAQEEPKRQDKRTIRDMKTGEHLKIGG